MWKSEARNFKILPGEGKLHRSETWIHEKTERTSERKLMKFKCFYLILINLIDQQSPTFLAPGTSFPEDNFSTDQG